MTLVRPNRAKRKLARGQPVVAVAGLLNADMIDFMGPTGIDAVWLEDEHGAICSANLPNLTRACDLWGMTSIIRLNQNGYGPIYKALDLGAQGIAIPHIDTTEDARRFVEAAKFAPIGRRGVATGRQGYGVESYFETINDATMLIAFIEDIKAIETLDAILDVDHIDVFFVAPSDLAASIGHIGDNAHPDVVRVIEGALRRIIVRGRTAGALANTMAETERYLELGVNFFMSSAQIWMQQAARGVLERIVDLRSQ